MIKKHVVPTLLSGIRVEERCVYKLVFGTVRIINFHTHTNYPAQMKYLSELRYGLVSIT
jgi:hypothetical protein